MSKRGVTVKRTAVHNRAIDELSSTSDGELLAKQFADGLDHIGPAIAFGGAVYPLLLALIVYLLTSQVTLADFGESMLDTLLASLFFSWIGLIWATVVGFATLPLVYLFVRTLELRGSIVRFGAFCGGLVGFVAAMPFFIGAMKGAPDRLLEISLMALLGPGLTTMVGQLGGAWGGWRTGWFERDVAQAATSDRGVRGKLSADGSKNKGTPHPRLPFGIRHLLIVSIWIGMLLTAIRLSGLGYLFMLSLIGGWFVFQAATIWVGGLLVSSVGGWSVRRQSRST